MFILQKSSEDVVVEQQRQFNSFLQGFVIAIINPKILIWFMAIFSQFINTNANIIFNTTLVLTASIIDALWYILVSLLVTGYGFKNFLLERKKMIQKITGSVLILIALSLLYRIIS